MNPGFRSLVGIALLPIAVATTVTARADSSYFAELPGKHVDDALSGLAGRGYNRIGTEEEHGSTLHYLWNERNGDCEVISSRDGRVRDVTSVSASVCHSMNRGNSRDTGRYDDRYGHDDGPLPHEVTGLVGNKRDDAEGKLASQGFQKVDGDKAHGRTSSLWWNRSRGQCISVESKDGRVRNIQRESRSTCD